MRMRQKQRQRGGHGGPHGWGGRFRGQGYRVTIPRQAILSALSNTTKHLSAEDIYLAVHKNYPGIGLTTVYRTLELLARMGLVSKFDFQDGRSRYELIEGKHHHHLVCVQCGQVIDYTDFLKQELEFFKKTEHALSKKYKFKINTHQVYFLGLCNKCG